MVDKANFFGFLRRRDSGVFGTSLSQRQVEGTEALLDALDGYKLPHAAHVLAEVYHETGGGMYPIKETVFPHSKDKNPSDAQVVARLDRAWSRGQLTWVKAPYWRDNWFGRGQIQITHDYNYLKASALTGVDLMENPDRALDVKVSAVIAAEGCRSGMFTGKRLSDYDGAEYDHYSARAIVNGDRRKNGHKIAAIADRFEQALAYADWGKAQPKAPPAVEVPPQGVLAAIISAILSIFGGRNA